MRTSGATAVLALALLANASCDSDRALAEQIRHDESIPLGSSEETGRWLFWPTSVRIYPLTHVVRAPPSIDVRLEFRDETGDTTKAVGTIVLVVQCDEAEPRELRWKEGIDSLSAQRRVYDSVTETYHFVLTPQWTKVPPNGSSILLRAFFFGANGATSVSNQRLGW